MNFDLSQITPDTIGAFLASESILAAAAKILLVVGFIFGVVLYLLVLMERKIAAWIQGRVGPNRVGPWGLLQMAVDAVKLVFKEELVPKTVIMPFFALAPGMMVIPAILAMAAVPFGIYHAPGSAHPLPIAIANINVGVLYLLAVTSLGVYGLLIAGWASNNKYALMGGLRASAQALSYEIPMGLAIVGTVMLAGSARLGDIVLAQHNTWFVFPAFIGFVVFLISIFAETNRTPFDLPEGETEIIGFHVEYSSMKFAAFSMAEYANMVTSSAMLNILFLGGWEFLPGLSWNRLGEITGVSFLSGNFWIVPTVWFFAKISFMLFIFLWVRWTLPRFRYDQLMNLGWKRLIPLALVNIVIVAIYLLANGGRIS